MQNSSWKRQNLIAAALDISFFGGLKMALLLIKAADPCNRWYDLARWIRKQKNTQVKDMINADMMLVSAANSRRACNVISTWASVDMPPTDICLVTKERKRARASPGIARWQIHYHQNTWSLKGAWMGTLLFISHCISLGENGTKPEEERTQLKSHFY